MFKKKKKINLLRFNSDKLSHLILNLFVSYKLMKQHVFDVEKIDIVQLKVIPNMKIDIFVSKYNQLNNFATIYDINNI